VAQGPFAFAAEGDVKPAKGVRSGTIAEAWQREPPRIALLPDPLRGAPVVEGDQMKLSGTATSQPSSIPARHACATCTST